MADAVVLVSGGAAVTPFTDPDRASGSGLAAGNTLTALRAHLLERGAAVFTAPARIGDGEVREDAGWQGFADVPVVLPAEMTVNAVGGIDEGGARLATFLRWLGEEHGLTDVDLVAHSMGGLFSRAAIRHLQGAGPSVHRLVTLGTPWEGSLLGDVLTGEISANDAAGDEGTAQILERSRSYAAENSQGAADQVSRRFLREWNAAQVGVLDTIAVTASTTTCTASSSPTPSACRGSGRSPGIPRCSRSSTMRSRPEPGAYAEPMQPLVAPVAALDPEELVRTARHAVLSGIGEEGQRRLNAAHVTIIGAGGLGSPVLLALAAAGIGTITVIDDDIVELTNLQRQLAHRVEDIGALKTASAARAITALAPQTVVTQVPERLDAVNAERLLAGADVVVDTSDSFATRRDVAAAAEALGLPLVWGAVQEWHAQATVFWSDPPEGEPVVLADLFPLGTEGEPPSCAQVGVLGALCVQVGGLLAGEVIKLLSGAGEPLLGRLAMIDALTSRQHEIPIRPASAATRAVRA